MKKCMNCNINVGGSGDQCPICQNSLVGDPTPYNWPSMRKLKLQSFFYKLQLFIVLTVTVVCLSVDYLMDGNAGTHWSLPIALWAITLEMLIRHFIKKCVVVAEVVTLSTLHLCLLLLFTSWFWGFLDPILNVVVPILICVLLVTNLILALADKKSNAMVYLLINILVGVIPYIILFLRKNGVPVTWTICLMISVVTFIGICVFKGRGVLTELEKRMNI